MGRTLRPAEGPNHGDQAACRRREPDPRLAQNPVADVVCPRAAGGVAAPLAGRTGPRTAAAPVRPGCDTGRLRRRTPRRRLARLPERPEVLRVGVRAAP